jgi:hypothetical protein
VKAVQIAIAAEIRVADSVIFQEDVVKNVAMETLVVAGAVRVEKDEEDLNT